MGVALHMQIFLIPLEVPQEQNVAPFPLYAHVSLSKGHFIFLKKLYDVLMSRTPRTYVKCITRLYLRVKFACIICVTPKMPGNHNSSRTFVNILLEKTARLGGFDLSWHSRLFTREFDRGLGRRQTRDWNAERAARHRIESQTMEEFN